MERHHERRTTISPILFLLLTLTLFITGAGEAQAGTIITGCTGFCHGMPPKDGIRKGNPHFTSLSSSVKGNHQTHANALNCSFCHGDTTSYTSGHQNNKIEMSANIHSSSPTAATYSKGTFFNQTTVPPPGSCSNVNCHFATSTDPWGTAPTYSVTGADTTTCGKCHGAPPATKNHLKHFTEFGATVSTCRKCHPDHAAEFAKFQHATSAAPGGRNLSITFAGAPNGTGSYTGSTRLAYPSYLATGGIYGTCSTTYCHSVVAQTWGGGPIACGSCHPANNTLAGKHSTHYQRTALGDKTGANTSTTTAYIYECGACHFKAPHAVGPVNASQTAQIFFNSTTAGAGSYTPGAISAADAASSFNYTNGTCTNTYCHSNGAGIAGNNTTFTWTSAPGTLGCNGCHNYTTATGQAMATGKHTKHTAGTAGNYSYSCAKCHLATTTDGATIIDKSKHVNKTKDVGIEFNGFLRTTWWNGTQCVNTYCHGDGTSFSTPSISSISWSTGTTLTCAGCHTGGTTTGPTYANGTPKANSHGKHVVTFVATCNNCHNDVTSNGTSITNAANHVNQAYNIQAGGVFQAVAVSYAPTPGNPLAASSCSTITCHSNNSATWGTKVKCQDCHFAATDVDDLAGTFWNNNVVSKIGTTEWSTRGHGATTAYASGNPGASFTTTNACEYCHDYNIGHKGATNPFRLKNYADNDPTWGLNKVCMNCHAPGSVGVTVDGVLRNSGAKVSAFHHNRPAVTGGDSGQYCWDCHDGHGDNNAFMIHATVYKDSIGPTNPVGTGAPVTLSPSGNPLFSTIAVPQVWGDFVKPTFNGVCQVCHTITRHFNITTYDTAHNPGTVCTTCHNHNGTGTANSAFSPAAGAAHVFPFPGSTHLSAAGTTPWASCVNASCHTNAAGGIYPVAAGTPPNCTGCHLLGLRAPSGTSSCYDCHGASATDGLPNGATFPNIAGSHSVHTAITGNTCATCHTGGGSGIATHGSSNRVAATPASVKVAFTGQGASPLWTFASKTCSTTNCHGLGAPTWGATSGAPVQGFPYSSVQCAKCHSGNLVNDVTAGNPFYATTIPKVTVNTNAKVGAHSSHITSTDSLSNPVVCLDCHGTVTLTAATHMNGVTNFSFNALATKSSTLTSSYNAFTGQCTNVYCHGANMSGGDTSGTNRTPTWSVPFLPPTISASACGTCHGFPPPTTAGHPAVTIPSGFPTTPIGSTCSCHANINPAGNSYANIFLIKALHIDGKLQVSAGVAHVVPFFTHNATAAASCLSANGGCHSTGIGSSPYPTTGAPDCMSCHTLADPLSTGNGLGNCKSCHGTGGTLTSAAPTGTIFPNIRGTNILAQHPSHEGSTCSSCHPGVDATGRSTTGAAGSGSGVNHGPNKNMTSGTTQTDTVQTTTGITPNVPRGNGATCNHNNITGGCSGGPGIQPW